MRATVYLISLLLAAFTGGIAAAEPARSYQADMHEAAWHSEPGQRACHLFHSIPRYGTALITRDLDDTLHLTLFTRRPPEYGNTASILVRAPRWRDGRPGKLGQTSIYPQRAVLKLGHRSTARILAALEAGSTVVFRFPSYFDDAAVEVALSPVRFVPVYRRYLDCLPRVQTGQADVAPSGHASPSDNGGSGRRPATADGHWPVPVPEAGRPDNTFPLSRRASGGATGAAMPAEQAAMAEDRPGSTVPTPASVANPAGALPGVALPAPTHIHFGHDSDRLDREDLDKIHALARKMTANPHWSVVVVTGHADSRGDDGYNKDLGLKRAQRVRQPLIDQGVEAERVRVATQGEAKPVADNSNDYGRARNRHVTITPMP